MLKDVKTGLDVLALPPPRIEPCLYIPLWGWLICIQRRWIYPCCKSSKPTGIYKVSAAMQHRSFLLYPPPISECHVFKTQPFHCTPGSVVGIATGYGLDGPGSNPGGGRDFPHLSTPALGPTQPPVQWVSGLSEGWRAAGARRWPLTPF